MRTRRRAPKPPGLTDDVAGKSAMGFCHRNADGWLAERGWTLRRCPGTSGKPLREHYLNFSPSARGSIQYCRDTHGGKDGHADAHSAIRRPLHSSAMPTAPSRPAAPSGDAHCAGNRCELMGASMSFARNAEIYGENEPADYLYKVISGSGADLQGSQRRPPADRRVLPPGRHFRPRDAATSTPSPPRPSADAKVLVIKRSAIDRARRPRQRRSPVSSGP